MEPMKIGLTLGKFAPFHKGHQYLIETALSEMDHLIVIIYDCPETTPIPLTIRACWIKTLYPSVEVIEAWDGPPETGNTPKIQQIQEQYIAELLKGRPVTHFYSSEFYGEHMSRFLNAVNRTVDEQRTLFPVSGTVVRNHSFGYRDLVDPLIYKDLIVKVAFLGAPSTGKTTICQRLAKDFRTVWMPEYGREYWETHQIERRLTPEQLVEIAEGHLEREEKLLAEANQVLFVDTNAITTYMFSMDYHNWAHSRLEELASKAVSRYDLVFLCGDDVPYDDTWDRSGEVHRAVFQKKIVADLTLRNVPYLLLNGSLEQRIQTVKSILKRYTKYKSLAECLIRK